MDYMNEIMARLQKGESVDTITADMTKALNEANDKFQKQRGKNEKAAAMRKALNAIADLIDAFDLDKEIGNSLREMDAMDLIDEIEREMPFMKMLIEMDQEKKREKPAAKPSGDSIEDFLNKFVR